MSQPVGYLRKSKVTSDRHVSWDVQEQEVRALAARHGDGEFLLLSDWSKSGRESKTRLRTEYARLRAMVAADEVSALYSYSLSRLARSTRELLDLAEACAAAHVPIRLAKEGDLDFASPHGRLYLTVLAAVATFEADVTGERMRDAVRARRARGDRLGIAPYGHRLVDGQLEPDSSEPLEPIVAAYRRAGSCYGAARFLNESGSRTRRGSPWTSKVVGDILDREGVAYNHRPRPGAKAAADWTLFRLLICPCGNVMTAMDKRGPRYTCYKARHVAGHPRPFGIRETKILPAVIAEASRLRAPDRVTMDEADAERREALATRRSRVLDMYESGLIEKADRDGRLYAIADELERLDAETHLMDVPPAIDWSWPPAQINTVLRALWERVDLGSDLTPTRFVWRVPEWRAPDEAATFEDVAVHGVGAR